MLVGRLWEWVAKALVVEYAAWAAGTRWGCEVSFGGIGPAGGVDIDFIHCPHASSLEEGSLILVNEGDSPTTKNCVASPFSL